jgi:hypothetical protein
MMNEKKSTPSVPVITAKKTKEKDIVLDKKGFFVIELVDDQIQVEFYHNVIKNQQIVSGKLAKMFVGRSAAALSDTIAQHIPGLRSDHLLYLGRELMRAERALKNGEDYEQDGC